MNAKTIEDLTRQLNEAHQELAKVAEDEEARYLARQAYKLSFHAGVKSRGSDNRKFLKSNLQDKWNGAHDPQRFEAAFRRMLLLNDKVRDTGLWVYIRK
ncbi:hypothetical protein QFC20_003240 [Naganishia adeliensis]|uniref:Uncharacterized protein n=1 Tax=Naganishia adeliensis TaxID=92952 RepID=A0ACC2WDL3_9TREE|nr:hypothetical protein QFC20_003240 [Naganishia adeliensis]